MTVKMIICAVLVIAGLLFMLASLIGIAKLPDFFTRLHAQGIGDTLGAFLILAGMMAASWGGLLPVKIFLIFIVIVLTNPLGTNLMMIAAINKEDYLGYRSKMTGESSEKKELSKEESAPAAEVPAVVSEASEAPVKKEKSRRRRNSRKKKTSDKKNTSVKEKKADTEKSSEQDKPESSGDKKKPRKRKPKPSMRMNKEELIKAAENRGIKVPEKATKKEILDLIYAEKSGK